MSGVRPDIDRDLWGRGSRRWLRIVRRHVRACRPFSEAHVTLRYRLAHHWPILEAETFQPLIQRARERGAPWVMGGQIDWRISFLALVTEVAYWWGFDVETTPDRGEQLRGAVDELSRVDREVRDLAGRMGDLLERGSELRLRFGLATEWTPPGPNLWGLLEAVAEQPKFQGTCLDSAAQLGTVLRYMRGTTRSTPCLVDILDALAMCAPGEPVPLNASDAEALSKAQGARFDAWPTRVRKLFASLAGLEWCSPSGRRLTALDCMNAKTLAPLANAAAGFHPFDGGQPGLGVEAIEKALQRFRAGPRNS